MAYNSFWSTVTCGLGPTRLNLVLLGLNPVLQGLNPDLPVFNPVSLGLNLSL